MSRCTLSFITLILFPVLVAAQERRPNIVVVLADDLGWGDLGCYGHPLIKTPNLDAFAKQGVRLTQCYSASGVCSPSRSAILTGRTPYRNGVYNWIPDKDEMHLRRTEVALPKLLKDSGYTTCHVGKWHLNGYFNDSKHPQPSDHGYDWWLGTQNNAAPSHAFPTNFVRNGQPVGKADAYSAPFVAREAITWLKEKRDKSKPFFLAVWTHEPHYPIAAAPEFKALYPDIQDKEILEHHACVTQLDHAFGQLMKALDDLQLADNTFVLFTSDNGPEGAGNKGPGRGSAGGLRGRKRAVYEGGIRVAGLVRWPGHVKPGTTSDVPVVGTDIFVTGCALAGITPPRDRVLDGGDLRPALEGKPVVRTRPLYWRCPLAPGEFKIALRIEDWKILTTPKLDRFELYNLRTDPKETKELSAGEPAKFKEMKAALEKVHAEIEAEGPRWTGSKQAR